MHCFIFLQITQNIKIKTMEFMSFILKHFIIFSIVIRFRDPALQDEMLTFLFEQLMSGDFGQYPIYSLANLRLENES